MADEVELRRAALMSASRHRSFVHKRLGVTYEAARVRQIADVAARARLARLLVVDPGRGAPRVRFGQELDSEWPGDWSGEEPTLGRLVLRRRTPCRWRCCLRATEEG
ncbi:hypothetical protein [Sphaerisporangium sp. NPDC051011]|uniref:hypothetical protein n=1 Tax=Sphaerisporangium sp. NPDC051011 TaxID=3155792 RepID=UPI0033CEE520